MSDNFDGFIRWLHCKNCSFEFPVLVFSGDSDWITSGLRTRTDTESKTVYVYVHDGVHPPGVSVDLVEVSRTKSIPGESFQDFQVRAASNKDRYIYRCVKCNGARAEATEKLRLEEFVKKGYRLGNLINQRLQ